MNRISIFTTSLAAAGFEDFHHGDTVFSFELLGPDGPRILIEGPAWAFVDWVMDDLSGLEMCRRLRADPRLRDAHITMVLEHDDKEDRRRALKAGADDYAIGPLDRQAMLDRVLALHACDRLRGIGQMIELGELQINVAGEQALWKGKQIPLRPNEFRVLRFLAENPNRVLSRQELVDALGKAGDPEYLRTVDVWIKRLRFGLRNAGANHLLRTVHGKGYVLDLI
ncbi:two-component system phosphate regulon response regulator PhoB [Altererythrobacter atlanticus]|uniref:Phosphate regulon transcriptional regulatory protein PhoB n=1 Tax=Croceibacterium atlanticum TaxID=1267766 RepID=A0A0F7KW56_9SPHN|nr:response regulator transcription factor [Croceibacterium atlanticum]AKH43944.1 Phosphate regulon transcriptional regulatory protein PhoB [Croceibacterium atlanticum]MBB5733606.1 two-component system phosphate regulon response regulator PhoB [Croceibacterium atlanticum]